MAFMQAEITFDTWYTVETDGGESFLIPADVCGDLGIADGETIRETDRTSNQWDVLGDAVRDYTNGRAVREITARPGYCGRLSAPGYMDQTDWSGPYDTEEEAQRELADAYDLCPNCLEECPDGPCDCEPAGLEEFTRAYLECALFASTLEPFGDCPECHKENVPLHHWRTVTDPEPVCGDCGVEAHYEPPADDNYDVGDLAPDALTSMREDCRQFLRTNRADIPADLTEQAGHDFWLTRNRHGAGFWDRGDGFYPDGAADRLTEDSHAWGESNLYVGDDGKIHVS